MGPEVVASLLMYAANPSHQGLCVFAATRGMLLVVGATPADSVYPGGGLPEWLGCLG